jgi:hypothetical protein
LFGEAYRIAPWSNCAEGQSVDADSKTEVFEAFINPDHLEVLVHPRQRAGSSLGAIGFPSDRVIRGWR